MVVVKGPEELERAAVSFSGVEEYNLVPVRAVIFLIPIEETAGTQIRIDVADTVHEYIWADKAVVNLADMLHDPFVYVLHKLVGIGLLEKGGRHVGGHLLVFLEHMLEKRGPFSEGLFIHEQTELLEDVKGEDIDVVARALDALLYLGNLVLHLVLLVAGIQVEVEVVKEVSVLRILERFAAELVV